MGGSVRRCAPFALLQRKVRVASARYIGNYEFEVTFSTDITADIGTWEGQIQRPITPEAYYAFGTIASATDRSIVGQSAYQGIERVRVIGQPDHVHCADARFSTGYGVNVPVTRIIDVVAAVISGAGTLTMGFSHDILDVVDTPLGIQWRNAVVDWSDFSGWDWASATELDLYYDDSSGPATEWRIIVDVAFIKFAQGFYNLPQTGPVAP